MRSSKPGAVQINVFQWADTVDPLRVLDRLVARQLGHPKGLLGAVIARVLNKGNAPTIAAAVAALELAGTETAADIGFGGGLGLHLLTGLDWYAGLSGALWALAGCGACRLAQLSRVPGRVMLSLLALAVHGLVDAPLVAPRGYALAFALLGMAAALSNQLLMASFDGVVTAIAAQAEFTAKNILASEERSEVVIP